MNANYQIRIYRVAGPEWLGLELEANLAIAGQEHIIVAEETAAEAFRESQFVLTAIRNRAAWALDERSDLAQVLNGIAWFNFLGYGGEMGPVTVFGTS